MDEQATQDCGCFETVDAMLRPKNTKLSAAISLESGWCRPMIAVEKVARGPRPTTMLPTFCPFCGSRYPEKPALARASGEAR